MSFITFNRAPPNLCCKHVPTDSLKELIAPNNLTIWLLRSIPTRLLALQRLRPIQMALWLRESVWGRGRESERASEVDREWQREKEREREVVKACQEAERRREWQRPPSAPCLSCWRPRTPAKTLNLYDPNGRPLTGMLLREDSEREKGSKWERKTKGEIPEPSRARGSHLAHHHIYFSSASAVAFGNTKTKCKLSLRKNKNHKKSPLTLPLLAF